MALTVALATTARAAAQATASHAPALARLAAVAVNAAAAARAPTPVPAAVPQRTFVSVIQQYERGVSFTLGRITSVKEPGLRINIPILQDMVVVDLRTQFTDVPTQRVVTRDNVSVTVDAAVQWLCNDALKMVMSLPRPSFAISEQAQLAIREVLSHHDLNQVLHNRDTFAAMAKQLIDDRIKSWGITIAFVSLKDIRFEDSMVKAMATKAEAERKREAQIIAAEGERETATKFAEAAQVLTNNPTAFRLRALETLVQMARAGSTIVVVPSDLIQALHTGSLGKVPDMGADVVPPAAPPASGGASSTGKLV